MNDVKFTYKKKDNEFELIENGSYDEKKEYPLFKSNESSPIEIKGFEDVVITIPDYPIATVKIRLDSEKAKKASHEIEHKWKNGYKDFICDIDGVSNFLNVYDYNGYRYIVLRNSKFDILDEANRVLFPDGIGKLEELGTFHLDERLTSEILELDQNLQSCISIDLMLELMEENSDMNKYIDYIKKNVKDDHLEGCFFFDEYIYDMFSKTYVKVLEEVSPYKHDIYGRKGLVAFITNALTGEFHDECKCSVV